MTGRRLDRGEGCSLTGGVVGRGKGECWGWGLGVGGESFPVCRTIMGGRVDSYPFDQPALPALVGCVSRYRFFVGQITKPYPKPWDSIYKTIPQTMKSSQIHTPSLHLSYPKD